MVQALFPDPRGATFVSAVEFRILGPLEGTDEIGRFRSGPKAAGSSRPFTPAQGEVVSTDRLVDGLWGERPPPTAVKSLQVYVSQLRKALGDGVLETRGRGYLLRLAPDQLDSDRFEVLLETGRALLASGEAPDAADAIREALALWRGPPLADFAYEPFAQPEIVRLEELRLGAMETRIDADLALGRHAELVPELEALTRQHPLREHFRTQLMLALYRCGRQADALEGYKHARAAFVTELGLEPSRELQDLEGAILRQDPELDAPAVSRHALGMARRRGGHFIAIGGALLLSAGILAAVITFARGDDSPGIVSAAPNSVAVIDPETNQIVAAIPVPDGPTSIAVGGGKVWVLNRDAQTISLIDAARRALVKTFAVGATPADLAFGAGRLWVGDSVTSSVVELEPDTGAVARKIAAPPLLPAADAPGAASAATSRLAWAQFGSQAATLR